MRLKVLLKAVVVATIPLLGYLLHRDRQEIARLKSELVSTRNARDDLRYSLELIDRVTLKTKPSLVRVYNVRNKG
jgi:hypothetical protein